MITRAFVWRCAASPRLRLRILRNLRILRVALGGVSGRARGQSQGAEWAVVTQTR
ncbi:hypothetical protein [Candidatus Accumulibacter sp. ACC007]|uniref:hypothetical protein n=1 Tax=Candidatus Accumulibacter sp. ACC007 TaxID=2823333 RepID=UPI0025BEE7E5|nr:hypothetical protein [Candidatus Accumulibacter sp. ACC007]